MPSGPAITASPWSPRTQPNGIDRELRVSYFSTDQTWGETKGINFRPLVPGDSIGLGLSAKALRKCLHCHATWFRAVDPLPSVPRARSRSTMGSAASDATAPG